MNTSPLVIAGVQLRSRLFLGTGKYSSGVVMAESIAASGAELVTVALRRVRTDGAADDIIKHLDLQRYRLLPNTSGARDAKEAILAAELARDALETNWLKLEIHPDPKYLMPDPVETLLATRADHKLSRPVCRYPALPHYKGSGDPRSAESFECKPPG